MADAKLKNSLAAMVVPAEDADALLSSGDGDAALLYIYLLRAGSALDVSAAARQLGRSDRDMAMAAEKLASLGLLTSEARPSPPPNDEAPAYAAAEIARRSREDSQFRALVPEIQVILGRSLSRPDLDRLFAIYDALALPAEVILLLAQYCKDESRRLYGPGRTVGMAFLYKVAQEWFDRELMTPELAEEYLRQREERRSVIGQLRPALCIRDRDLTKTERAYLDAWLDLRFPPESIALAADRTITRTGGMKWNYADAILRDWHERGLHTPEEIEAGDGKPASPAKKKTAAAPERDDAEAMDQIRRLRKKLAKGE